MFARPAACSNDIGRPVRSTPLAEAAEYYTYVQMPRDVHNPPVRFAKSRFEADEGQSSVAELDVHEEQAKSILSRNDSPDLSFTWSVNPYRGCFHACAYCYARPTHAYLDLGAGTDFDRQIIAKVNAAELLRDAFDKKSWQGETIVFSGNTDCYQPIEARYELTRSLLKVCAAYRNPVAVITKSLLVKRDIDVLRELHEHASCVVTVSCAFASDDDAKAIEPFAPPPSKRFELVRTLADAGIPVGVSLAPTIPGLNDSQIPEVLRRAVDAGATHAFHTLLRMPLEVATVFEERVREAYPLRANKILSGVRQMRGGAVYDARFGERMHGRGERYSAVEQLFEIHHRKLGLAQFRFDGETDAPMSRTFRRPSAQLGLFDD